MKKERISTESLVFCAILTAIVFLLQYLGAFVRFGPFSVSLVLLPIVIGTAVCGAWAGAWLGLMFGIAVLVSGDAGAFLAVNIPGTVITVILKGVACGYISGLLYNLVSKFNKYAAVVAAAIVCPVVNTGVFLLGCLLFFMDTIALWTTEAGLGGNVGNYMIFVLVGGNFLFELGLNIVVSPVIVRILNAGKKLLR